MSERVGSNELNIQKLLESEWARKNREKVQAEVFKTLLEDVKELKVKVDKYHESEVVTHEKLFEVEEHYEKSISEMKKVMAHHDTMNQKTK